jgi:glycosyltransferase involved in cell wall biosynthesis
MRLADSVIFYTEKEVLEYRSVHAQCLRKRVIGLNNGIDTSSIAVLRRRYEPELRPRALLFIGRLNPKAKLQLLLKSMSDPGCGCVTLEVVGDGPMFSELRKLASELGLEGRVRWHGGITDETRIAAIANRCRVFVYPGSVGLSLIHGLSYGLPAVIHGDRWSHEPEFAAFQHGWNGLAFVRSDAANLTKIINTLVDDLQQLRMLSVNAIATTSQSFNVVDMASRFVKFLNGG